MLPLLVKLGRRLASCAYDQSAGRRHRNQIKFFTQGIIHEYKTQDCGRSRCAVLLSACSSPKHEPMPLVKFTPSMEVTEVWSKGLSSAEGFLVPAVYDDMVFAAGGKTLTRLNARTGETEWSVSFNSPITGGVGSDGYVTAVGLWDGNLEVVDAEGKVSWEKKLTTELASPPVVSHGLVIARTMDTRVSAFEASSGELQWTYQRSQPALTVRLPTRMLAHDNFLLVGQPNGHIVILDIASGNRCLNSKSPKRKA